MNIAKLMVVCYICYYVGVGCGMVGQVVADAGEVYPPRVPLVILLTLAVPAILGYLAGRFDNKEDEDEKRKS